MTKAERKPSGRNGPAAAARIAVAASGGADSTALLHCVSRHDIEVHALHVHHGLMPDADAWLAHVAAQCARWRRSGRRIEFHAERLAGKPARGESVEAWARRERYAALARMAHEAGCRIVLLAHHRRDQAETFVLQALRGSGPAGLAAMPHAAERDGLLWLRPWLAQPRSAIDAYVERWGLAHVYDGSNADVRFARSRLRTQVWPVLDAAFPDAERSLAAAARRVQQAAEVVAEVASADAARVIDDDGVLNLERWRALGAARQAFVLRRWLPGVPERLIERLLVECHDDAPRAWPLDGGHELRVHRGCLHVVARAARASGAGAPSTVLDAGSTAAWHALALPDAPRVLDLSRPGDHADPPWRGHWQVSAVEGEGSEGDRAASRSVPAVLLAAVHVRERRAGDRFVRTPGATARGLKKQHQALGVAPWLRDGPLLFAGEQLVYVAGLGLDARACGMPGSPRVRVEWVADEGLG